MSLDADKAVVDNKLKVTEDQLRAFIEICWTKYVKAKIEPGIPTCHRISSSTDTFLKAQLWVPSVLNRLVNRGRR